MSPIYVYGCQDCGKVNEKQMSMQDEKPTWITCTCGGCAQRQFTLPGTSVHHVDGEWVVRAPGEVGRERKDARWRRKHRPDLYEEQEAKRHGEI